MEPESTPIVPAQRVLEIAGALSDGAVRMHAMLGNLDPAQRDAVLALMTDEIGTIVELWSELVRAVVSAEPARGPSPEAPDRRRERLTAVPDSAPSEKPPAPTAAPGGAQPSATEGPTTNGRDELTGVFTRPAGIAAMNRELERCRQVGARFVLGFVDIDGMSRVNETQGPEAGDELLRKVAAALRATLRAYDVILRFGGDEFLFSLAGADTATAELRLREFSTLLAKEVPGATASLGFAELHPDDSLEEIIIRADQALAAERRPERRSR